MENGEPEWVRLYVERGIAIPFNLCSPCEPGPFNGQIAIHTTPGAGCHGNPVCSSSVGTFEPATPPPHFQYVNSATLGIAHGLQSSTCNIVKIWNRLVSLRYEA